MKYKQLGRSGLLVSELCLGTMTFGGKGFWSSMGALGQSAVDQIVKGTADAGINFIDTADVYSDGDSEQLLGQALKNTGIARKDVVVATKGYGIMGPGVNDRGTSRGHLFDAIAGSLKRLQTDYIDLYQVHAFDPVTPVEETLSALDNLVQRGLVRYIGCSNWAAWQLMKALGISDKRNLARFETIQSFYTIASRDLEREVVPLLKDQGVGLMVWSPLAGGVLADKSVDGKSAPQGTRRATFDFPPVNRDRVDTVIAAMRPIAKAHGASVARVALAWLLAQKHVTSVIIGAKSTDQLQDNIAAVDLVLTEEELAALDQASALPMEYPGWMIARQSANRLGGAYQAPPPLPPRS
jgi:aryl-alcohol dehydrogenase-like predicted oxidoreductase